MSQANGHARILPLDGLRALAFGAVFFHHAYALPLTWSGVDLFFVLSGYLITGILLRSYKRPSYFRNFYVKRTFRIFPAYFATIGLAAVALPAAAAMAPWCVVFLGNVHRSIYGDGLPLTHLWSLAVEEQFYLLWPLALAICPGRHRWRLIISLLLLAPIFRMLTTFALNESAAQALLPCRMDLLAAGAGIALLEFDRGRRAVAKRRPVFLIACVGGAVLFAGLAAINSQSSAFYTVGALEGSVAFYASLVALTLGAPHSALAKLLAWRPLVYLGQISYCMYLVHLPILQYAQAHLEGPLSVVIALIATIGLSAVSWRFYETRLIAIGSRLAAETRPDSPVPTKVAEK